MTDYQFINLKHPIRTTPGIGERAFVALLEWFTPGGVKSPGAWVTHGDEVRIKDSHEFLPGEGFNEYLLAPEKNSYEAKTTGDTGMQRFANEVKLFLPGSYATLHEIMYNLVGQPVIVLIRDADCPAGIWYQIGTECIPARIAADFETGTTKEGVKGYLLTITNTATKVYLYEGDITYPGEGLELKARLTGGIAGSAVTLDASASSTYGTVTYQYTVHFNDVDDNPQSIVLPETGDHATFDTAILTNWNGAGLAVVLSITNGVNTDKTRTADPEDQRPLILGGFDEGFDTGFDFNWEEL